LINSVILLLPLFLLFSFSFLTTDIVLTCKFWQALLTLLRAISHAHIGSCNVHIRWESFQPIYSLWTWTYIGFSSCRMHVCVVPGCAAEWAS
jgi:hypothetical protein